jgi:hypothetical protein
MKSMISGLDVSSGLKFLAGLPSFLSRTISTEQAKAALRLRFQNRDADFLSLVRKYIYDNPDSPYLKLLRWAGCGYGDLSDLVYKEGVEGALRALFRNGVYLTVQEYKGRVPTRRGTQAIDVHPGLLANPSSKSQLRLFTSGGAGRSTFVPVDLDYVRDRSIDHRLLIEARNGWGWRFAVWGVPGNTDIVRILELRRSGAPSLRWFSQVDPNAPGLHPRYRWSIRLMRWAGRASGVRLPNPEYVPLSDPLPIVRWIRAVLDAGEIPHLTTWVTSAMNICRAAASRGIDISGLQFTVGGEPLTSTRLAFLKKSGTTAVPRFMSVECAYIGYGCLNPDETDDYHSINDFTTVIQPGPDGGGRSLPPEALLVTTLRRTTPLVLLNVSLGDQAVMAERSCGCPLEKLGWSRHLRRVRSFDKLTSGGMTFLDTDIAQVMERILPSRFGGTPLDYQVIEEEAEDGRPRVYLLVSPAIGPVDPDEVLRTFYEAIGRGAGAERVMSLQWRSAGLISVRRQDPRPTASGKILPILKTRA